jgi:hypothetical protein
MINIKKVENSLNTLLDMLAVQFVASTLLTNETDTEAEIKEYLGLLNQDLDVIAIKKAFLELERLQLILNLNKSIRG